MFFCYFSVEGRIFMTLTIVLVVSAVIAALDQLVKYFIVQNLAPTGSVSVIDNLLSLVYVENRGVAFGMFQDHILIFVAITALLIAVFVWLIVKKRFKGKMFLISSVLLIGGGVGNLIDRIIRGFVVDYLSLSFFPPVCNLADYCITVGAVLFVIVLLTQTSDSSSIGNKKSEKTVNSEQTEENTETPEQTETIDHNSEKDEQSVLNSDGEEYGN